MSSRRPRSARARVRLVAAAVRGLSSCSPPAAVRSAAPRFFPTIRSRSTTTLGFDASAAQADRRQQRLRLRRAHVRQARRPARHPARSTSTRSDEVPDSSWFTNRIGRRAMPIDEIVRGPNPLDALNIDGWPIVQEKSSGITPGYRVTDPSGRLYQIKFDPPGNPEMASGAEVIGAAIYHALGYNVVAGLRRRRRSGEDRHLARRRRPWTCRAAAGRCAATTSIGCWRAPRGCRTASTARPLSRFADGRPLGYFKYYGTRPDDPNDIHPHEHRRELRGNRVFAAWLNHDDSRGLNSLDMLEGPDGAQSHPALHVRLRIDHGQRQHGRAGAARRQRVHPRMGARAEDAGDARAVRPALDPGGLSRQVAPSVGRFEADFFDPAEWRPEYPNPAFDNMRPDDAFWAARLVARFSRRGDPRRSWPRPATASPARPTTSRATLIKRRDKVLRTWLTGVNPDRRSAVERGRRADVRERRRQCRGRVCAT